MKSIKELGIKSTNAFENASYWNHHGAYQEQYEILTAKMVPFRGASSSVHGELLRGVGRLFYEYCNNGNCNALTEEGINPYYDKFLTLIDASLADTILPEEVHALTDGVRAVIRDAGKPNQLVCEYFSEENVNKYNALCDAVIWYACNSFDRPLPANYECK